MGGQMPLLDLVHDVRESEIVFSDGWRRCTGRVLCAECMDQPTRGRYWWWDENGDYHERPVCPGCWSASTGGLLRIAEPLGRPA